MTFKPHTIGSKYDPHLSAKDIAKLVRAEIKAAIKAGRLPAFKTSVRTGGSSTHDSIDLEVLAVPEGFTLHNPEWAAACNSPARGPGPAIERYTPEGKAALALLESILQAYNYDNSDSRSDYFHVNFYGHVRVAA